MHKHTYLLHTDNLKASYAKWGETEEKWSERVLTGRLNQGWEESREPKLLSDLFKL